MDQIDFQPNVQNLDQFYQRKEKKKLKQKEIDQISAFNTKNSKINHQLKQNDDFEPSSWNNLEGSKATNLFDQQGKELLSSEQSFKKLNAQYLLTDEGLNLLIIYLNYFAEYSFWLCIINIGVVISNAVQLSFHIKSECFMQANKRHKSHRLKFNQMYLYLLILSIITCSGLLIRAIIIALLKDEILIVVQLGICYIGVIYFELKLFASLKYIILVEGQINKDMQEGSSHTQNASLS